MKFILGFLNGKKTYILAALVVLASLVRLATGDVTLSEFLNSPDLMTLLGGLSIASMRAAVAKN